MDRAEIEACRLRANSVLTKIPGVRGVGFGLKEVGGKLTETMALRVYVREKRRANAILEAELIPREFEGLPTDIIRICRANALGTEDRDRHSELISGISITNLKPNLSKPKPSDPYTIGSIGFFATMEGLNGKENVFLVSNHHVLAANGGSVNDTIYQPRITSNGNFDPENLGSIGKVYHPGFLGHHSFKDEGDENALDYFVDCAFAKLDISVSSACECNLGQSYANRLHDFSGTPLEEEPDKIRGMARAVEGARVSKSGRTTGRSIGRIVDTNGIEEVDLGHDVVMVHENIIIVAHESPDKFFAIPGDSGSPLLNDENEQNLLIGLVHGNNRHDVANAIANNEPPPIRMTYCCHIAAVLDYLGQNDDKQNITSQPITPITTQNPPIGPAGEARSNQHGVADVPEDCTVFLQERIRRTQQARALFDAFLGQRREIVRLINHCRPVLVAWHRGKGPAFFAHLRESASRPGHVIPAQIDGQSRHELLVRMADVLAENGSPNLRIFLSEFRDEVLFLTDRIGDLHAFVAELEGQEKEAEHA